MAHYDFYNFGTATCAIDKEQESAKQEPWLKQLIVNYYTGKYDEYQPFTKYFKNNLLKNTGTDFKSAAKWASRNAGFNLYLGYNANFNNLYKESEQDLNTYFNDYCKSKHKASWVQIYSWKITVNSFTQALYCYLFKHHYSLVQNYSYTEEFDKTNKTINVTFKDNDSTQITIELETEDLETKTFIQHKKVFAGESNTPKWVTEEVTYTSILRYYNDVFNYYEIRKDSNNDFEPSSNTAIYITYAYGEDSSDGTTTYYDSICYNADLSNPALEEAIKKQLYVYSNTPIEPFPCLPIKQYLFYIPEGSEIFNLCAKYIKKAVNNKTAYKQIYDACKNNDDARVHNTYLLTGVPLNGKTNLHKKYLFTFFDFIYNKWLASRGLTHSDIRDEWYNDGKSNHLYDLNGYISYYGNNSFFGMNGVVMRGIAWHGIWKRTVEGIAKAGIKVGQYAVEPIVYEGSASPNVRYVQEDPDYINNNPSSGNPLGPQVYAAVKADTPGVSIRYQETDSHYVEILIFGLIMVNPVGHYGVGINIDMLLYNYSIYCNNLGSLTVKPDLESIVGTKQVWVPGNGSTPTYGPPPSTDEQNGYYKEYNIYAMRIDTVALGLKQAELAEGSIYIGVQNVYMNYVVNIQTGHKTEIKIEGSTDDSGFIIPLDMATLEAFSTIGRNDLLPACLYAVSEYYQWDRVHYKRWKKVVLQILQIVVIIVTVVLCAFGQVYSAPIGLGISAGLQILINIIIKIAIAVIIKIVMRALGRMLFGDSIFGAIFEAIGTIVCQYYLGAYDGVSPLAAAGMVVGTFASSLSYYYGKKTLALQAQLATIAIQNTQVLTEYKVKSEILNQRLLALSNPNSNFIVGSYIDYVVTNPSQPICNGLVTIGKYNNTLISYQDEFSRIALDDMIDLSPYTSTEPSLINVNGE